MLMFGRYPRLPKSADQDVWQEARAAESCDPVWAAVLTGTEGHMGNGYYMHHTKQL